MYDARQDGIRSYDLAIKEARRKMLEPTEEKLWDAIGRLRQNGVLVRHIEGEGICSIWNIGPLNKVGYFEVIRAAGKIAGRVRNEQPRQLKPWPKMGQKAFR